MKKWFCLPLSLVAVFSLITDVKAQAVYTATRNSSLQVGAGYLYVNLDYSPKNSQGVSGWVDANLTRHFGLEVEGHYGNLSSPSDYAENSFFIGPRASIRRGRASLYGKVMIGHGTLLRVEPYKMSSSGYAAYGFGGGLDYRVSRRFHLRLADIELQKWPTFKPNGLSPYAISSGVLYSIH